MEVERWTAFSPYCGLEALYQPGIRGAHGKGGGEGQVGRLRRNRLVPVLEVGTLAELNPRVDRWDQEDDARRLRSGPRTLGEYVATQGASVGSGGRVLAVVRACQSGAMRSWSTSTEDDLRRLLNDWDPLSVADDVQDEYDCMLAPLLQRLRSGGGRTEIGQFLRHELEDHFGLDPLGLRPDAMAVRVVEWWKSTGPAGDMAGA
ncbi:hypothetical protein ACF07V_34510 [Streptomyces sp. NPDC015661]|uniref:hypothetical protein n=1 Tax=Streptomyces sp. NPDC015661 TaxID=3364961 RepID=UPI0036FA2BA4